MVIVFDLDDTLYDELDFVASGFRAVAAQIDPRRAAEVADFMHARFEATGSGRVFDDTVAQFGADADVAGLVELYRGHSPDIALPPERAALLASLRQRSPAVDLGLVSDGPERTQRNKFDRLGLGEFIDRPVFTAQLGAPKPAPAAFLAVMERFGPRREFVYVADNPRKDFIAPRGLGWHTIRFRNPRGIYRDVVTDPSAQADVEIDAFEGLRSLL